MNDLLRVLLVEDNPGDADLIMELLPRNSSTPLEVENVSRLSLALECIGSGRFDIVLLDLGLPDSNGLTTLRAMRQQAVGLPIIVMTGNNDERTGLDAIREGAQDYLIKGQTDENLLARAIKYSVERKQSENALKELNDTLEERVIERTAQITLANETLQNEIADRKRAEEALRLAKEEWERTFNSVPDLIAILDNQHRVLRVNESLAQRLGIKAENCVGLHCYEAVHGTSVPPDFCPHSRTITDGLEHSEELHVDRFGGDFQVTTTPLLNEKNERIGSVHIGHDITEKKHMVDALRESEAQFRTLANAIPHLCWMAMADGWIFWYNQRWFEYTGTTPEQMNGWGWQSVHDPDALSGVLEQWQISIATGKPFNMVFPLRGSDNVFRPFLTRVMPVFDQDGKVVRWFGTNTDISEQRMTEDALRESDLRFRLATEATGVGIWEWNVITNKIRWDHQMFRIYGVAPTEDGFIQYSDWSGAVLPEDLAKQEKILQDTARRGGQSSREFRIRRYSDSEYRDIQAVDTVRTNAQGQIEWVVGTNLDVTERKQAEESLQKFNKELEKLVKERTAELRDKDQMLLLQSRQAAMGEMIGNIAHQWRQPLNTLGLFTQRLGCFYGTPNFNKEFLDKSVAKSMEIIQYMSHTIDDFRNFFSTEREKSEFNINDAVNRALTLVGASFEDQKIKIDRTIQDEFIINGYPNEYGQVLLNILINARDAITERNINSPRVEITIRSENGASLVTIADNAGGIPEDIIDKIFDPYFTTKGPQHGTGVGLFMSKAIIEKNMGGRLTARNTNVGAEFRIEV